MTSANRSRNKSALLGRILKSILVFGLLASTVFSADVAATRKYAELGVAAAQTSIAARAQTLHGVGKTGSTNHLIDTVEVILNYDESQPVKTTVVDDSGRLISASEGFRGRISIRFSSRQGDPFLDHDLVITQWPSKESSLLGYFMGPGISGRSTTPMILRVDLWDSKKKFFLYSPEMAQTAAFVGMFGR